MTINRARLCQRTAIWIAVVWLQTNPSRRSPSFDAFVTKLAPWSPPVVGPPVVVVPKKITWTP